MRTTLELLNEVISMGFAQYNALEIIDAILDEEFDIADRKPLSDEELPDDIYNKIMHIFQEKGGAEKAKTELKKRKRRK